MARLGWRKTSLLVLVGIAGIAAVLWSVRMGQRSRATTSTQGPSAPAPIVAPGVVEGRSDPIELCFEVEGRIAAILVEEGQRVLAGQVLARIDASLYHAEVARAEAALQAAQARRDVVFRGARKEEIEAAAAEAEATSSQASEQSRASARGRQLRDRGALSTAEAERLQSTAETAVAQVKAAEARLELLHQGSRPEARREALASLAVAQAEVARARLMLARTELRAPQDGVILRRLAEAGEHLVVTTPRIVLTMVDDSELRVRAEVDETDVARVRVGQRGYATANAFGTRKFHGQVIQIMKELGRKTIPTEDPLARTDTRVLEVIFRFDNRPSLPMGLRMDVHFERNPGVTSAD